jgi:CRP-like cAMP-binding protein
MSIPLDITAFSTNYLVRGLSPAQIQEVSALATTRRYAARDRMIMAGSQSAELYVILAGNVHVHLPDSDKLAEVGPGSVLGEMSLIDARPRSADVMCLGLVDAAVFDAPALRKYLNSHRDLGFTVMINLAQVLCGRLRDSNAKIEFLAGGDAWKHAL